MNATDRKWKLFERLARLGITREDAIALRRIEMTLSRWSEGECGDSQGRCIERDEETGRPFITYDNGNGPRGRYPIADREKGALKRLAQIMARYPNLVPYHQGDPRGCALYLVPREVLTDGSDIHSVYNRGMGVCS